MSPSNNLPELFKDNPWDKTFSSLIDFLNKFYTDDIRGVAGDLGLSHVGGKQDLLHRVVNCVLIDNQKLGRMFKYLAHKPFVRRRTTSQANENPLEKIWRQHQANEGITGVADCLTKKRLMPSVSSVGGSNLQGAPPAKRMHQITLPEGPTIPIRLQVVECTYCPKTEANTSPVFWCPQCRTIQHKNCVFGSPIGLDFKEKCRSWDLFAAYLILINAESYNDLVVPSYITRP